METLIRCCVLWHLIWVCTVCQLHSYGSPDYNGLNKVDNFHVFICFLAHQTLSKTGSICTLKERICSNRKRIFPFLLERHLFRKELKPLPLKVSSDFCQSVTHADFIICIWWAILEKGPCAIPFSVCDTFNNILLILLAGNEGPDRTVEMSSLIWAFLPAYVITALFSNAWHMLNPIFAWCVSTKKNHNGSD